MGQVREERVLPEKLRATIQDIAMTEMLANEDPAAFKRVYAKAFQAWADGAIDGAAVEVFEAVHEVLES